MDWYGDHVKAVIGADPQRSQSRSMPVALKIKPVIELLSDPIEDIQSAADLIGEVEVTTKARPHKWMQRAAGRTGRVSVRPSGVTTWEGRVCCYEHLTLFEGRSDLPLPHDTTCPTCQAVYRIRLGTVRGG